MKPKYYCPNCGRKLEQGEYGLDYNTGNLHIAYCPDCGEVGSVVNDAEQAIKKYCTENVDNFAPRYDLALDTENRMRCSLQYADSSLYNDLNDRMIEWCKDNDEDPDDYNIEDIF